MLPTKVRMNTFTIIFAALYGLGIASAQTANRNQGTLSPIVVDCGRLNQASNRNLTWACQKRPCNERSSLEQEPHILYNEYHCNPSDYSEICCLVYPDLEHKGGTNAVVTEPDRKRLESSHDRIRPESSADRNRPESSLLSNTVRSPIIKGTSGDESLIRELQSKRFSQFDRDLLHELSEEHRNKNIIVSPASVKSLLALLVEGSSDETAAEILKLLQLSPATKERRRSIALLRKLQSLLRNERSSIRLESQNRIYRANNVTLKEEYENTVTNVYHASVQAVNFSNPEQASFAINNWIKNVTRGLIPKIVEEDNIHENTKLFLVNYIYLKASWDEAFNPMYTRVRCFYPTDKDCQQVKFMNKKRSLNYTDSADYKSEIFEIPFKDSRYTMVFMLPHKNTSVHDILKNLNRKNMFALFGNLPEESIKLSLPRTVIGFNSNLVQPLQRLGVRSVFERNAKLTNMLKKNAHFSVTDIVHKARIELNEEGAEATGISGANIQTLSLDVDKNVVVDRPFLFFIRDTTVNGFLFEGIVFSPDKAE